MHGFEEPLIEEADAQVVGVEFINIVESNLHTTLGRTQHHRTLFVVGFGTYQLDNLWAIRLKEQAIVVH